MGLACKCTKAPYERGFTEPYHTHEESPQAKPLLSPRSP